MRIFVCSVNFEKKKKITPAEVYHAAFYTGYRKKDRQYGLRAETFFKNIFKGVNT